MCHGPTVGSLVRQCRPTLETAHLPEAGAAGPVLLSGPRVGPQCTANRERMLVFHRPESEKQGFGRMLVAPQPLVAFSHLILFFPWGVQLSGPVISVCIFPTTKEAAHFPYVSGSSADPSV